MKLAPKIALCMVALLGVVFAIGGQVMIAGTFDRGMESAVEQSVATHLAGQDTLRRQLVQAGYAADLAGAGGVVAGPGGTTSVAVTGGVMLYDYDIAALGSQMAETAAASGGLCGLYTEAGVPLFSNLPRGFNKSVQTAIFAAEQPGYLYYRFDGRVYIAMPGRVAANGRQFGVISAFDVTHLFTERQMQTRAFYAVYAVVLLAAVVLGAGAAWVIVRPLRRLAGTSREIAGGAYAQRTGIVREDEIGEVAKNFDEMAAAVQDKVESLELSVKQRQDFMAAFTHELKTPMTSMMGYAALLEKGGLSGADEEKALGYIRRETKRLEELSQKLLMLLGLSDEGIELVPVAFGEVWAAVEQAFAGEAGCKLELGGDAGVTLLAEPDLLCDLFLNLINNAAQAGPKDGVVRVSGEVLPGGRWRACVADTGCGMAPEELSRIEEPFYRVDKSRSAKDGGSGLGLALCAKIAALHGTKLAFDSREGEGTTVCFTLKDVSAAAGDETNEEAGA